MNIFKLTNVSLGYNKHTKIIDNINLEIKKGEFVSIIGPNASGKSTIIKALTKLIKPLDGVIEYSGKNIYDYKSKDFSKKIAYVPQITEFPDDITVYDFVSMGRYPHNSFFYSNEKKNKEIINLALEQVNLKNMSFNYLNELSGGQKQRALIALALAQDTETIVLDEPTNHLDIKYQLEIIHLLHDLNHTQNKTIILVIHDINHGIKFANKVIIVNEGKIYKADYPNKVISVNSIKHVFGVNAKIGLSNGKKIIFDYWIDSLKQLESYDKKK